MRIDRLLLRLDDEVSETKFDMLIKKLIKDNYDITRINPRVYLVLIYDDYSAMNDFILSIRAASEDLGTTIRGLEIPRYEEHYLKNFKYVPPREVKTLAEVAEHNLEMIKEDYPLIAEFDNEILQTIKFYLEMGRSPSLTSERLYVHRNTVTYRVERFKAKTGLELEINHVAIYVYRVLVNYLYDFTLGGNTHEEI